MPVFDIAVLALIIAMFIVFGIVLGGLTWFCSDKRKHAHRGTNHGHGHYPTSGGLITDDD
jgi:hypothetical protein